MAGKSEAAAALTDAERAVFDEIYRNHHKAILKYIRRRVFDRYKAEDYVSDVFVRLAGHISEFAAVPDEERLKLLYRYAGSIIAENERKLRSRNTVSFSDLADAGDDGGAADLIDSIDSGEDIEKDLIEKELVRTLMREIDRLEPKKRKAILMRYGREMKTADIAAELDMNHSTLRRMIQNTLSELRRKIEDNYGRKQ